MKNTLNKGIDKEVVHKRHKHEPATEDNYCSIIYGSLPPEVKKT